MKSRPLPPRRRQRALPVRERNRRLGALGLSRHDEEAVQGEALAIVARFRAWTHLEPCCVTGWRTGEVHEFEGQSWQVVVEWAHITGTRGAFNPDFGCAAPLVDLLHRRQEDDPAFFAKRDLDPAMLARLHAVRFFAAHPEDARWLLEHANDGDVLALAREGLASR